MSWRSIKKWLVVGIVFFVFSIVSTSSAFATATPTLDGAFFGQYQSTGFYGLGVGVWGDLFTLVPKLTVMATTDDGIGPKVVASSAHAQQDSDTVSTDITPAGTNRFLAAYLTYGSDPSNLVTSVTFDGEAFTKVCGSTSEVWYLIDPHATAGTVTATIGDSTAHEMVLNVTAFSNVDQSDPIKASNCTSGLANHAAIPVTTGNNRLTYGGMTTYTDGTVVSPAIDAMFTSGTQTTNVIGSAAITRTNSLQWWTNRPWNWAGSAISIAGSSSGTYTPEPYVMQYEVVHAGDPFTDTPTYSTDFTFDGNAQIVSADATGLSASNYYAWQARMCADNGLFDTCSPWTAYNQSSGFILHLVNSPPSNPNSLHPSDGSATDSTPDLTFSLSDSEFYNELVHYEIEISDDSGFSHLLTHFISDPVFQGENTFTVGSTNNGTYLTGSASDSFYDGVYYWRVKAIDSSGDASTDSSAYTNANVAGAFTVTGNPDPSLHVASNPTILKQYKADDATPVAIGQAIPDELQKFKLNLAMNDGAGPRVTDQHAATLHNSDTVTIPLAPTGTNRVAIVTVNNGSLGIPTSVTFGGQNFTEVCNVGTQNSIWYLTNPTTTAGNVTITLPTTNYEAVVSAIAVANVDQSTPISNSQCDHDDTFSYHPSTTISTGQGQLIISEVSSYTDFLNEFTEAPPMTVLAGAQTQNIVNQVTSMGARSNSETLRWQMNKDWGWSIVAVSLNPAISYSPVNLIPQVEIKPIGVNFSNVPNATGSATTYAGVPVFGSVDVTTLSQDESYHWQAQACLEDFSQCSSWVFFGSNAESATDFGTESNVSPTTPDNLSPSNLANGAINTTTPTFRFNQHDSNTNDSLQYHIVISENNDYSSPVVDYTSALLPEASYVEFTVGQAAKEGTYATGNQGQTLDSAAHYYWKLQTIDGQSAASTFLTGNFGFDTVTPNLTNFNTTVTSNSATLTWDTDEASNTFLLFGPQTEGSFYTESQDNVSLVTSHSYTMTGLLPCVAYFAYPLSGDAAGNLGWGDRLTFTTTGCVGGASILNQINASIPATTGGTLSLIEDDVGPTVSVPVAAYATSSASLQIKKLENTSVLNETSNPTGYALAGNLTYDFHAIESAFTTITTFDNPVSVTMNYSDAELSGLSPSDLLIYRWDDDTWYPLSNCTHDSDAKTITCETSNFSIFGLFSKPVATNQNSPSNDNNSTNQTASNGVTECSNEKPAGNPDLFQISMSGNSATLYFSPVNGPVDKYFISYGLTEAADQYGTQFESHQSGGVTAFKINSLAKNQRYFFKVKAANGCKAGDWSNVLSAVAGKTATSYKFNSIAKIVSLKTKTTINSLVHPSTAQAASVPSAPSIEPSENKPPIPSVAPTVSVPTTTSNPSVLTKISNFFKNWWH